jgi:lysophospholipase L1-like esterase
VPNIPGEPELPVEEPPAPDAEPPVSDPDVEEAEPEPDSPAPEAPPDEQTDPDDDVPSNGRPVPGGSSSGEGGPAEGGSAEGGSAEGGSAEGGSVGPGSPDIPSDLPEFHITVIGSSTANGIGASVGDFAWVNLLDGALSNTVAARYTTTNLAVGGYTAADLLPGSGASGSVDEAIKEKPDLIVVALAGSNDITPGFTTAMFLAQLGAVRDAANAAGIPAFFMSPLPKSLSVGEREILGEWSALMAAQFAQCWIPGTTQPYAPCYIDVFDSLSGPDLGLAAPFDSGDGQHPNDAGHALLFGAVDAIVQPYVCSKTDCR